MLHECRQRMPMMYLRGGGCGPSKPTAAGDQSALGAPPEAQQQAIEPGIEQARHGPSEAAPAPATSEASTATSSAPPAPASAETSTATSGAATSSAPPVPLEASAAVATTPEVVKDSAAAELQAAREAAALSTPVAEWVVVSEKVETPVLDVVAGFFRNSTAFLQEMLSERSGNENGTDVSVREAFDAVDTDGSGLIDKEELKSVVAKLKGSVNDAEIDELFTELDLDKVRPRRGPQHDSHT